MYELYHISSFIQSLYLICIFYDVFLHHPSRMHSISSVNHNVFN